jgi:hypothetical protein
MRYVTMDQISKVAEVTAEMPLTRRERLARWAELLDQDPRRQLATLAGTEFEAGEDRALLRRPNSPFSLAFADPLLRASGLKDDTYGEAKRFFQLSDHELHNIVCSCHYGSVVSAGQAARHVRAAIRKSMAFETGKSIWNGLSVGDSWD